MSKKPFVLVLTGSIGMGKSTTARMFAECGVPVWDADATVTNLYGQGGAAVSAIGELALQAVQNGEVDKAALREAIAKDGALLKKIEARVHPLVAQDRDAFVAGHQNHELILLDIPLYYETSSNISADAVLVVTASEEVQRARVLDRGTMNEEEFEMIKARQIPDAEKRARADYVIETLSLEQTRDAVHTLIGELKAG